MTVGELVAKLKEFDPELPVMIDGYEGGIEEPKSLAEVKVALNYHGEGSGIFGPHALVDSGTWDYDERDWQDWRVVNAIYIPRGG